MTYKKLNKLIIFAIPSASRGQATVVGLVGIFVVGLVAAYMATAYSAERMSQSRANFFNLASQIQLDIVNASNSAPSWQATLSDTINNFPTGSAQSCLTATTPNCPASNTAYAFVLWPAGTTNFTNKANAIYDGTNSAAGFALDGTPCTSFSLSGSPSCPIHVILNWATPGGCPGGVCTVSINANIQFRPGSPSPIGPINENNFALTFIQALVGGTELCAGEPNPAQIALCSPPPYPNDKLYCVPNFPGGWECGQVYH